MEEPLKNIRAIIQITQEVMERDEYANKAFESYFKNHQSFSDRDIGLIVQDVYYLIRNWRLIHEIKEKVCKNSGDNEFIILAIARLLVGKPLPEAIPGFKLKKSNIAEALKSVQGNQAIIDSIPDWINNMGNDELGSDWPAILQSLNQEPGLVIRVNTLKCTRKKLYQELLASGIKTMEHAQANDALILSAKLNVFKLQEFKLGFFEMQDISSQLTGQFANPLPGMRIIDGCAGNGGKTLHLASLMKNKGKIIALDIFPGKLETLKCRAKRAGISIIDTRVINSTKIIKRLHESADLVLLDVPCSGLGVLKRNPEIKWRLKPEDLDSLRLTQEDILKRYSLMVKPGGRLVYSTCSILPSENSVQIRNFMKKNGEKFDFITDQFISPTQGFDGFYMAMLQRKS